MEDFLAAHRWVGGAGDPAVAIESRPATLRPARNRAPRSSPLHPRRTTRRSDDRRDVTRRCTGCKILQPGTFDHMPARRAFSATHDLYPRLIRKGSALFGVQHTGVEMVRRCGAGDRNTDLRSAAPLLFASRGRDEGHSALNVDGATSGRATPSMTASSCLSLCGSVSPGGSVLRGNDRLNELGVAPHVHRVSSEHLTRRAPPRFARSPLAR